MKWTKQYYSCQTYAFSRSRFSCLSLEGSRKCSERHFSPTVSASCKQCLTYAAAMWQMLSAFEVHLRCKGKRMVLISKESLKLVVPTGQPVQQSGVANTWASSFTVRLICTVTFQNEKVSAFRKGNATDYFHDGTRDLILKQTLPLKVLRNWCQSKCQGSWSAVSHEDSGDCLDNIFFSQVDSPLQPAKPAYGFGTFRGFIKFISQAPCLWRWRLAQMVPGQAFSRFARFAGLEKFSVSENVFRFRTFASWSSWLRRQA